MKDLVTSAIALVVFTVLLGFGYPLVVGVAARAIPHPAVDELVGRPFDDPHYFWGRLSSVKYNAMTSGGTNAGPTGFVDRHGTLGANPTLVAAARARIDALRVPGDTTPIPIDLVTASASGLDPDISPAAAYFQIARIARARGLAEARVRAIVDRTITGRTLGILGEPRVNVVRLNQQLDRDR